MTTTVEEKHQTVTLTDEGQTKVERLLNMPGLYESADWDGMKARHHVEQALRAHVMFHRDKDYLVQEGEVVIVDEFTGRIMPGRRWSDGLHQAIEAKEGVKIERENQTLATITFQNYFRMYKKLAGMTGTAETEAPEFYKTYKLEVTFDPDEPPDDPEGVPGHRLSDRGREVPQRRQVHQGAEREGQPVLVGTISVEKSERLSRILTKHGRAA